MNTKKTFKFYTQYNQFFIEDKNNINLDTSKFIDFWNENAFEERLAIAEGIIGVGIQSYGNVNGEIEILEKPNTTIDYGKYDHIVEGSIDIRSGELQILDSPNLEVELSIKVVPGKYKIRVYSSNLKSVKEHDLANDSDNDYYRIEAWKDDDDIIKRKVLKQYKE